MKCIHYETDLDGMVTFQCPNDANLVIGTKCPVPVCPMTEHFGVCSECWPVLEALIRTGAEFVCGACDAERVPVWTEPVRV